TAKGYFAFAACTLVALYGLWSIYAFGMADLKSSADPIADQRKFVNNLRAKLESERTYLAGYSPKYAKKEKELSVMIDELEEIDKHIREL
ncbi:hypothetical protein OGAPHI_000713, partial [Ogataea philodendri]